MRPMRRPFPVELRKAQEEIERHARAFGLDFFEVVFEVVDFREMNQIAAYGGFPIRYPHWRWGMEYEHLSKSYAYGLHRIYELVINNDPCYAYLLASNSLTDQKLVMAHVYAHCDFFKNNIWFSKTNRKMVDQMANHAQRIRSYMDRYGVEEVEAFIDLCLSIEDQIDVHAPFIQRHRPAPAPPLPDEEAVEETEAPGRFRSKPYMDPFINPPELLQEQRRSLQEKKKQPKRFPEEPEKDLMLFLLQYAPLQPWQQDVLRIVRDEAYYFAPQAQTKIMNEGWASYWHSVIMTQKGLGDAEIVDYADHHSGTVATQSGRLNPYKLGLELFRDLEYRWDSGRFGPEYERCTDWETRRNWNRNLGLGRQKIFEVRRIYNDVMFIDEFLTPEFCARQKLFAYRYDEEQELYVIESREFQKIKERLLFSLTNLGRPMIYVVDGNYENRGELYLWHKFAGVELDLPYARDTLENIYRLWTRPVHLETQLGERKVLLSYDGREHRKHTLGGVV
jgi:stage V sporulation protein R